MKKFLILISFFLFASHIGFAEVRIKDIAKVGGKRDIELIGYGLVTGLDGTGDKSGSVATVQSLSTMLNKMGVSVNPSALNVNNVAAVAVTARAPLFSSIGNKIDAVVSSIGNAESLDGGTLLLTALKGIDGKLYGTVQGKIQVTKPAADGVGPKNKVPETVGLIPGGVILERDIRAAFLKEDQVVVELFSPDFVTAERVVSAVKLAFNTVVLAEDPVRINVVIPDEFKLDPIGFLARLESLTIEPDEAAKVVINENTGTVVAGENVIISPVSISHGHLKIKVDGKSGNLFLPGSATVTTMVSMLNSLGATPYDISIIFKTLKRLGALKADLVIM